MGQVDEDHGLPRWTEEGGGLVVGNYCHDVIFRDGVIVSEGLGGATSFLSNVIDPLSPNPSVYVSKVGPDFSYPVSHAPITCTSSQTTLFHAHFPSTGGGGYHGDRVLSRIRTCEPILPTDLPSRRFEFGVAAGVAGEILPETLALMLDLCRVVLVDAQGLIRVFDGIDGAVGLVPLRSTAFFNLLPRIGFLKASTEEAPFVDVDEARKVCCVIVTEGKNGCRVYWKEGEVYVAPFQVAQIDPTGAGDSFLGGFVVGLSWGLTVPDAALLGNFFGASTVGQIGIPKFELSLLKAVRQELERRGTQYAVEEQCRGSFSPSYQKSLSHKEIREALTELLSYVAAAVSTELEKGQYIW